MANTIQIKHSPNDVAPASMSGSTHDLAKGELAWVDHSSNAGGANGKLYIGDATAAGAVQRHIGGVGTGAVSAAAAAGSLTGSTLASGVTASSLTSLGTIATLTATDYVIGGHTVSDIDRGGEFNDVEDHVMSSAGVNDRIEAIALLDSECTDLAAVKAFTGEAAATADQTDAEIRTAVEAASDSNVFTDADHSKLNGIEASATADQTKSDIDGLAITTVGTLDTGNATAIVDAASLTAAGKVELATTSETTTGTSTTLAVTPAGVQAAIDDLVESAPGAMNTLNELAAAINDDASFSTTVTNNLAAKAPIASPTFTGTIAIPNISNLETAVAANTAKSTNVSTNLGVSASGSAFTVTSSDGTNASLTLADTDNWGVMSDEMFDKLDGIEASATADQTKSDINGLAITTVGAIDSGSWTATDIAVSHGGTGASSASDARTNLGLAIGSDVQAYHATLAAVAGSTYTGDNAITTLGTIGTGVWQGTAISNTYLASVSGTNTGDEVAGTTSTAGVLELATDGETNTGTDTARAITPANLAQATLTGGTF